MATIKELTTMVGTLSKPGKMPCPSTSTPASACRTGGFLQTIPDSVCSDCYACKGMYRFNNVVQALELRLEAVDKPGWSLAMAQLIQKQAGPSSYFRWHDSGDVQSLRHLEDIALIAEMTPDIKHWLPTKEYRIVRRYLELHADFPPNLTVRVSAPLRGTVMSNFDHETQNIKLDTVLQQFAEAEAYGLPLSTVDGGEGHRCPAYQNDGKCGDCRACWDPAVLIVDYPNH